MAGALHPSLRASLAMGKQDGWVPGLRLAVWWEATGSISLARPTRLRVTGACVPGTNMMPGGHHSKEQGRAWIHFAAKRCFTPVQLGPAGEMPLRQLRVDGGSF